MTTAARTRETRAIHAGVHRGMGHTVSAHRAGRMALAALLVVAGVVEWSVAAAHANVPSNRSGLIAFQRNGDASGEVWVLNPNAPEPEGAAVKVSSDGVPEARPAYGPTSDNETWPLAFQRFAGGDWDIWSAIGRGNASNGEPATFGTATALVSGPGDQESPAYSRIAAGVAPLLAYTSTQTGARELWLRDAAGDLKQLTGDGAGYANPDFAGRYRLVDADGDGGFDTLRIGLVFERLVAGARGIWAMDLDVGIDSGAYVASGGMRPVATGPGELFDPSWQTTNDFDFGDPPAPLSDRPRVNDIVFATAQLGTTFLDFVEEPWTLAADGDATEPAVPFAEGLARDRFTLTGDPGGDNAPVWSPAGGRVAFERTTGGNTDVWTVRPDGTDLRRLTTRTGLDGRPSWQPDQESSVDRVGGHTNPGPASRNPKGPGPGGQGPGGEQRRSPRLAIRGATWRGRRIVVAGRAASDLAGRLRVKFACGRSSRKRATRLVRARNGRFRVAIRIPARCRRARRATVVLKYGGDRAYTSQRVSKAVRRSRR
jgi:hypothetical protein